MSHVIESPFGNTRTELAQTAGARQDQSRELAEMQVMYLMAQQFPRDPVQAMDRILNAFTRATLAEKSQYEYSRGGTDIRGPSIKAMEAIATEWGNIDVRWRVVSRGVDQRGIPFSEVEATATDTQTRTRKRIGFIVSHWRDTKQGGYKLTDERDIYELCANMAQRRVRACIEAIIPSDVIDAAMTQADTTLKAKADTSPEALEKMLAAFEPFGVTKAHIEKRIQRRLDAIQPAQVISLKRIYASLRDGMSTAGDWFETIAEPGAQGTQSSGPAGEAVSKTETLKARMREREQPKDGQTGAPAPAQAEDDPPTYDEVGGAIQDAHTVEELDAAADLIRSVRSEEDRELLTSEYRQKRDALDPPMFDVDPPPAEQPAHGRTRGRRA